MKSKKVKKSKADADTAALLGHSWVGLVRAIITDKNVKQFKVKQLKEKQLKVEKLKKSKSGC